MRRRRFLQAGAALAAVPGALHAQPRRRHRVGCLWLGSEDSARPFQDAFVQGLREHGYEVGRDIDVDVRYANGAQSRLPALAVELISLRPDVLVGVEAPARAIRARTTAIPIVLVSSVDPVTTGLVQSLPRPGVNVTGMAYRLDELVAKNLEILRELIPKASRVALVTYGTEPGELSTAIEAHLASAAQVAARQKGLALSILSVRDARSVAQAFVRIQEERHDGVIAAPSPYTLQLRHEIVAHARRLRLATISALGAVWAEAGGLVGYGPDFIRNYRYAASFVHRILEGAKAGDIPIEQPSVYQLVFNLKTAREIGMSIAPSLLVRADRVIE